MFWLLLIYFVFLLYLRPPRLTRPATPFPYATLFRSARGWLPRHLLHRRARGRRGTGALLGAIRRPAGRLPRVGDARCDADLRRPRPGDDGDDQRRRDPR